MRNVLALLLVVGLGFPANAQLFRRGTRPAPLPPQKTVRIVPQALPQAPPAESPKAEDQGEAPVLKDVPELADWEIIRRGRMVQETGTVAAGPVDYIADALSPPEDDSHKWYLSVVTMQGCKACERLKYDFIHNKTLQAWVNVNDPAKSTLHYQVRRVEDVSQKDWLAGIMPQLKKGGFPAIVLQPPRNGEYGPNKTVVAVIHGYDGDAEALTTKLRDSLVAYVHSLQRRGEVVHRGENTLRRGHSSSKLSGGNRQEGGEDLTAGPPPFIPDSRVDPFQPSGGPQDWPPAPTITALTVAQIQALCPGAPAEFVLQQLSKKASDPQIVSLEWLVFQQNKTPAPSPAPPAVTPATVPTPAIPSPTPSPAPNPAPTPIPWAAIIAAVLSGNMMGLVAIGFTLYRTWRKSTGKPTILNDAQAAVLAQMLNGLDLKDLTNLMDLVKPKTPTPAVP